MGAVRALPTAPKTMTGKNGSQAKFGTSLLPQGQGRSVSSEETSPVSNRTPGNTNFKFSLNQVRMPPLNKMSQAMHAKADTEQESPDKSFVRYLESRGMTLPQDILADYALQQKASQASPWLGKTPGQEAAPYHGTSPAEGTRRAPQVPPPVPQHTGHDGTYAFKTESIAPVPLGSTGQMPVAGEPQPLQWAAGDGTAVAETYMKPGVQPNPGASKDPRLGARPPPTPQPAQQCHATAPQQYEARWAQQPHGGKFQPPQWVTGDGAQAALLQGAMKPLPALPEAPDPFPRPARLPAQQKQSGAPRPYTAPQQQYSANDPGGVEYEEHGEETAAIRTRALLQDLLHPAALPLPTPEAPPPQKPAPQLQSALLESDQRMPNRRPQPPEQEQPWVVVRRKRSPPPDHMKRGRTPITPDCPRH